MELKYYKSTSSVGAPVYVPIPIDDKNRILFYCICWDCMMMIISYFVPIIFFDLNLNKMTIFGFVLIELEKCRLIEHY